jgi:hypothetical protein
MLAVKRGGTREELQNWDSRVPATRKCLRKKLVRRSKEGRVRKVQKEEEDVGVEVQEGGGRTK